MSGCSCSRQDSRAHREWPSGCARRALGWNGDLRGLHEGSVRADGRRECCDRLSFVRREIVASCRAACRRSADARVAHDFRGRIPASSRTRAHYAHGACRWPAVRTLTARFLLATNPLLLRVVGGFRSGAAVVAVAAYISGLPLWARGLGGIWPCRSTVVLVTRAETRTPASCTVSRAFYARWVIPLKARPGDVVESDGQNEPVRRGRHDSFVRRYWPLADPIDGLHFRHFSLDVLASSWSSSATCAFRGCSSTNASPQCLNLPYQPGGGGSIIGYTRRTLGGARGASAPGLPGFAPSSPCPIIPACRSPTLRTLSDQARLSSDRVLSVQLRLLGRCFASSAFRGSRRRRESTACCRAVSQRRPGIGFLRRAARRASDILRW